MKKPTAPPARVAASPARGLRLRLSRSLRGIARRHGIVPSALAEWLLDSLDVSVIEEGAKFLKKIS